MKKYEAQVSLMTGKSVEEIWGIWTDIPNWPKWDDSKKVEIDGEFKAGSTISCFSDEDPEPRCMTLAEVSVNKEFVDQTDLPFGTIKTYHTLNTLEGSVQVTHRMTAEINNEMADMFGNEIWPNIQAGIFAALNNLINL